MISAAELNRGNALSRTNQPALADLISDVVASGKPITFVVGAGLSIDSGLPDWQQLIDRLVSGIDNRSFARLAAGDKDDLIRKAEYVIEMYMDTAGGRPEDAIRFALYKGTKVNQPGAMSKALCQVLADLAPRASVVTTNFDDMLEVALDSMAPPVVWDHFTLKNVAGWYAALSDDAVMPVMHLHGIVRRTTPTKPVILTQSHFLRYGKRARSLVKEALNNTHVVFLGVSLTDPNLVGPLWDTAHSHMRCHVIAIPGASSPGETVEQSREFMLAKHSYLETKLGVRMIVLKSYSQLEQLLREMSLAIRDYPRYSDSDSDKSSAYGWRYSRAIAKCRANIGCNAGRTAPSEQDAIDFSRRLQVELGSTSAPGMAGSVRSVLDSLAQERTVKAAISELKIKLKDASIDDENFGLYVWLRSWVPRPDKPPYAIDLVGSSVFAHGAPWTMRSDVAIEPTSQFASARAIFRGNWILENLSHVDPSPLWRGVCAVPLRVIDVVELSGGETMEVPVTVGAVSLNTTHYPRPDKVDGTSARPVSMLAALTPTQRQRLVIAIEEAGRRALGY